jgi:cell division septal protein FtsQ
MAAEQARNREGWMESDPKRIVREWNREIEAEMRRRNARQEDGPWKIVVWVVLAVLWFVALFAVLALFERLPR